MGRLAAIVVAGGGSRRFGSDKLDLRGDDGRTLLATTVAGAAAIADPVIVVGPQRELGSPVLSALEDPPGGGPCAALVAGLALVPADCALVAVLAGDAPNGALAVPALTRVIDDAAAATVTDSAGREQPLTALYSVQPLREALATLGDPADRSVREVLDALRPHTVVSIIDAWGACDDIDVREDAERLGYRA